MENTDSSVNFKPSMDDDSLFARENDVTDALNRSVSSVDKYYKMNHPRRGKAIIFNHFRFTSNYADREGTALDVKNLVETLPQLGFRTQDIEVHEDLTACEISDELQKVRKEDHSDTDLLMVFVLTHGSKNDEISASDVEYSVESLWEPFRADKCPTLAGKPKIFFVIACRGQKRDTGLTFQMVDNSVTEVDAKPIEHYYSYPIPVWSDFLYVFSTYKGYVSYRNTVRGTWYIQAFCKELSTANISRMSFTDFLTAVNGRLLQFEPGRQTPTFSSTLTKCLYFTEKNNSYLL